MTDFDLDELDRLHEAATMAPWHWFVEDGSFQGLSGPDELGDHVLWCHICKRCRKEGWDCTGARKDNRDLIVALRNAYPALAAEIRKLRAEITRLRGASGSCAECERLTRLVKDTEDVIADRGIVERDCSASLPARVDAIIVEMKNAHHDHGMGCVENEKLTRENAKLRRVRDVLYSGFEMKTHDLAMRTDWVIADVEEVRAALDAAQEASDG